MTTTDKAPVADWATDFDHTHPEYAAHAPEIWDDLRERCPVAHSDRFGGIWLPTRHADVEAVARDTDHYSSEGVIASPFKPEGIAPRGYAPPITSDPPFHAEARRLLLPAFAPKAIARWEGATREACRELVDDVLAGDARVVDAAADYAQHIPVRVIAEMLGVPREDGDRFRVFIHRIMETPGEGLEGLSYEDTLDYYLNQIIESRRAAPPQDDLIGYLLEAEMEGQRLDNEHIRGTIALLIIAGIDTTWSAIGASLWHLAQHPEHRARLRAEPELVPFAVEELLRFYAPVTMARIAASEVDLGDEHVRARDWVLLPFPAANRDPEVFEDADRFVIDRQRNRHVAFGVGIHRCLGSNLARMELTVALEEWLARIPEFELADPDPTAVTWSTGQVRGPRQLPIRILDHGDPV
ncbi:cytochrome P450 [Rhabdothermincola salaria]|uniref:cytochrome P450 n=1 Tax=Rhabdothermincola salaria TaxID=2903142 RepID=UPI001E6029B3|nr:cytochrome P450 [Rhabdothermincola salaria]MCD9622406.1 cytochrome P450 [Rhabdothermincola salaria]